MELSALLSHQMVRYKLTIIQLEELYFDFIYLYELIFSCNVYFHKVYALII